MFVHYRTRGFIFKKEERGEADQLFAVYTKDFGKLEILGKAIRKISSKLRAGTDIFYLSEIEFIQGKTHKTLTDAIPVEKFENVRKDLKKLSIAYKISEVLDDLVKGQEPDEKIWQLLAEAFQKLNDLSLKYREHFSLPLLYYYFLWNLLSTLGYEPELYHCPLCQKKLVPGKLYFSSKEGGIICQDCFKKVKSGRELEVGTVKILRIILKKNWPILSRLKIEKSQLKELELLSKSYLTSCIGEASGTSR